MILAPSLSKWTVTKGAGGSSRRSSTATSRTGKVSFRRRRLVPSSTSLSSPPWVLWAVLSSAALGSSRSTFLVRGYSVAAPSFPRPSQLQQQLQQHKHVFVNKPSYATTRSTTTTTSRMQQQQQQPLSHRTLSPRPSLTSTRLFSMFRGGDDDDNNNRGRKNDEGGGFLTTLARAAKSVLPSSWFQSEEERKAAERREQVRKEVSGGLRQLYKDAPFPLRMFGDIVTPLFSSAMSTMAETMAQQQEQMETVLQDAKSYLVSDETVVRSLGGEPLEIGMPFSQSSSTTSINGKATSVIELAFPVTGRSGSAVAQLRCTNNKIQRLQVQTDSGRLLTVNVEGKPRASFGSGRTGSVGRFNTKDDDIIEAEIIEKETKK